MIKKQSMPAPEELPLVRIVDDDAFVRSTLIDLLRSVDLHAVGYASSDELVDHDDPDAPGCIVLDVNMPGTNGLDLHDILRGRDNRRPVIFMTGEGTVPITVRAMKGGAVDFLVKPFSDQDFVAAIEMAIAKDRAFVAQYSKKRELEGLLGSLTVREREVMTAIVGGMLNKQIAGTFGISEVTVKLHRRNLMRKMQASSFADLIRKAELLGSNAVRERTGEGIGR